MGEHLHESSQTWMMECKNDIMPRYILYYITDPWYCHTYILQHFVRLVSTSTYIVLIDPCYPHLAYRYTCIYTVKILVCSILIASHMYYFFAATWGSIWPGYLSQSAFYCIIWICRNIHTPGKFKLFIFYIPAIVGSL